MKKKTTKKTVNKTVKKKKVVVRKLKTAKQKKLLKIISENIGNKKGGKTMKDMMLEAGYSESMANQQSGALTPIKESEEFGDYIDRLKKLRERLILRMESTADLASHSEVSASLARIENIVLLSDGKPTSNVNILSDEDKGKLDNLFGENS